MSLGVVLLFLLFIYFWPVVFVLTLGFWVMQAVKGMGSLSWC